MQAALEGGVSACIGDWELGRLGPAPTESLCCCHCLVKVPARPLTPRWKQQQLPSFQTFRRSHQPDGEANGLGEEQGTARAMGRPGAWVSAPPPHATASSPPSSTAGAWGRETLHLLSVPCSSHKKCAFLRSFPSPGALLPSHTDPRGFSGSTQCPPHPSHTPNTGRACGDTHHCSPLLGFPFHPTPGFGGRPSFTPMPPGQSWAADRPSDP